jgi:pyruvate formate lyase activating enzyme
MDTALETSGYGKWEDLKKICEYASLIFYDIKHLDPDKHLAYTGVTNELVLENIRRVSATFPKTPIIARTPIVPGFNDSPDDIGAIVDFLSGIPGVREYELLAYHRLGEPKYRQIGRKYSLINLQPPSQEHMARLRQIAQKIISH